MEEKYEEYLNAFFDSFIFLDKDGENEPCMPGHFIPGSQIINRTLFIGDGTINMAEFAQFLFVRTLLNDDELPTELMLDGLDVTLDRLSNGAYEIYKGLGTDVCDFYPQNLKLSKDQGFWLRDDLESVASFAFEGVDKIESGYSGSVAGTTYEDTCYSPFISQDQVWNMCPIIPVIQEFLGNNFWDNVTLSLKNLVERGHTIYNPYLSKIMYFATYLNIDTDFYSRQEEREKDFQEKGYKVKVKRGANNWYFAYGFRRALKEIDPDLYKDTANGFKTFLYKLWYIPFIFLADRVYYPIATKLFGVQEKCNSYYCLATTSGVWYGTKKGFTKRLIKRFNKSLEKAGKYGTPFSWHLVFLQLRKYPQYIDRVDWDGVKSWLQGYSMRRDTGTTVERNNPIAWLTVYSWSKYFNKI